MINFVFDALGQVLAFCYNIWPSYGVAIAGLTLVVMIVVTPFTLKGTKSMLQMSHYQPEMKAIREKYKHDRQKLNQELMAFQRDNNFSMFGGCLPMLVQMPVFLVLYRVVQGLTSRITNLGNQFGWTTGRISNGNLADATPIGIGDLPFQPVNLPIDSDLYQDITGANLAERPTEIVSWGMDLARSAQAVISDNILGSFPYLVLIVLVLVTSLIQTRQIRKRSGSALPPQQQMVMKFMPYFLPIFSFTLPAALVIYFVVSNLYRIGQQAYITRNFYRKEDSPGALLAKKREEAKRNEGAVLDSSSGKTTPKKGAPTPRRDGTFANDKRKKPQARRQLAKPTDKARTNKSSSGRSHTSGRVTESGKGSRPNSNRSTGSNRNSGRSNSSRRGDNSGRSSGSRKSESSEQDNGSRGKSSLRRLRRQPTQQPESNAKPKRTGQGRTGNAPTRHHKK